MKHHRAFALQLKFSLLEDLSRFSLNRKIRSPIDLQQPDQEALETCNSLGDSLLNGSKTS